MQMPGTKTAQQPVTALRGRTLSDAAWKWILLIPSIIVVAGLLLFPMAMTLYVSFTDWHLYAYGRETSFVGLANWVKVVTDIAFLIPIRNTVVFVLGSVPTTYLVGLVIALSLNQITTGRRFFRVFFMMPLMISPVAISLVIGRMLLHESMGPINDILVRLGMPIVHWLTDPTMAMVSLIIVDAWHNSAFMILMLTAGLQALPQDPYEAATVDGASTWQTFWYITLPLLAPISVTALLIRSLDAFKVVDIVKVVTGGGPGTATESVTLAVYDLGVKAGDIAMGAAGAYSLLIVMIAFSTALLLATRRWVQQAS